MRVFASDFDEEELSMEVSHSSVAGDAQQVQEAQDMAAAHAKSAAPEPILQNPKRAPGRLGQGRVA